MSTGIESFIVSEKTYKVQTLDVLSTIALHVEVMHSLGTIITEVINILADISTGKEAKSADLGIALTKLDPAVVQKLQRTILAQVITPDNRFLSDPVVVEEWFSKPENADDVWEVLVKGGQALLGKHLPRFVRTRIEKSEKTTA